MSGQHAKLFQPSKAELWVNCTGMIALLEQANLPDEPSSVHAASGTFTHSLSDRVLEGHNIPAIGERETHDGFEFQLDTDRLARVAGYTNAIKERGGMQFYEQRLSLTPVIGIPDQFGTADAVIANIDFAELEVHDLKDGRREVEVKNNWQLITYALAALAEFGYLCDFKTVSIWIYMGQAGAHTRAKYTIEEMMAFQKTLRERAQRGNEVRGLSRNKIIAALNPGEWCEKGWCRMRGNCPARNGQSLQTIEALPLANVELSDERLGQVLLLEKAIKDQFTAWKIEALNRAKVGNAIPGWKLATGRQGDREWTDTEKVGEEMYEAIQAETYVRALISPAVAEKKLKKDHAEVWVKLQAYINRSPGNVTLVPEANVHATPAPLGLEFAKIDDASDLI